MLFYTLDLFKPPAAKCPLAVSCFEDPCLAFSDLVRQSALAVRAGVESVRRATDSHKSQILRLQRLGAENAEAAVTTAPYPTGAMGSQAWGVRHS